MLTVSIIQTNLEWQNKEANLAMLENKIKSITNKTQVIVLPEMFTTGFTMQPQQFAETMDGTTIAWMKKISKEKNAIITGSVIIEEEGLFFNRLIWMLPNGTYGCYDKRHLFAYADEHNYYTPGTKRLIASVNGWKINLQICYDLRFPIWARQQISHTNSPEYDVLIYVANWPQSRINAWKILLPARAIENQCYVIGVNRVGNDGNNIYHNGNSMIVDALGNILYQKENDEDIFTITLEKNELNNVRDKYPFWKDADNFMITD